MSSDKQDSIWRKVTAPVPRSTDERPTKWALPEVKAEYQQRMEQGKKPKRRKAALQLAGK